MAGNPRDAFRTGFPAVVYHHISLAQYWGPSCLHILYSPNSTRLFRMPHDANSHNRKLVSFEQLLDRYLFAVGSPTHSQGVSVIQAAILGNQVLCGTKPRTLGTVN